MKRLNFSIFFLGCLSICVLAGRCDQKPRYAPPKRVVLLVIDALRKDHVSAYGYGRNTTPNFDRLGAGGIVFANAFATSSWTQPSMASLFTGAYPIVHKVCRPPDSMLTSSAVLPPELETMAEFLRQQGMKTKSVSSQPWCNDLAGFDQGFDDFDSSPALVDSREAEKVMDRALAWLDGQQADSSFFLYIHIMGPHFPYIPPPEFKGRYTTAKAKQVESLLDGLEYDRQLVKLHDNIPLFQSDPALLAEIMALYDEETAYSDHQLGRLLALLKAKGMFDETMLIVCSDHGEEFLEHGNFTHGNTLFREVIEVPLTISYPPFGQGLRPKGMVSLMDIYPTLIGLFNKDRPFFCQGKSLVPVIGGGQTHSALLSELIESGIVKLTTDRYSLVYRGQTSQWSEALWLFDLAKDPGELKDVSGENPEKRQSLLSVLLEMENENMEVKVQPASERQLTEEQQKRLRSLGYIH